MAYRGGNGGGMQNMMKQAQKIQEQMQQAEAELEEMEVLGFSGGGSDWDTCGGTGCDSDWDTCDCSAEISSLRFIFTDVPQ